MSLLAALFAEHGQSLRVTPDVALMVRGQEANRIYQVRSGQVLLHATSTGEREIGIAIVKPGGVFGIASALFKRAALLNATTLNECDLLALDAILVEELMKNNLSLTRECLDYLAAVLIERIDQIEELAVHGLKTRLARWILRAFIDQQVSLEEGASIQLTASQRLIAVMAGVSRETVNRQLKRWDSAKIIQISGRTLRLLKPGIMLRLAGNSDLQQGGSFRL